MCLLKALVGMTVRVLSLNLVATNIEVLVTYRYMEGIWVSPMFVWYDVVGLVLGFQQNNIYIFSLIKYIVSSSH